MVRAKFRVSEKTERNSGVAIRLEPVYSSDPASENGQFYKWTPAGAIGLSLVSESTAANFKVGAEYYVDFTPAGEG